MHLQILTILLISLFLPQTTPAKLNLIDIYRKEVFDYAVLRNNKPVIVYYTSKTCTICSGLQNRLEEFAKENNDKMYLAFVDFDKRPELKEQFGITRVPTTRTYYKGKMMDEVKIPVWPAVKIISQKALKAK